MIYIKNIKIERNYGHMVINLGIKLKGNKDSRN